MQIPHHTQDVVLDTISEVFSNICFKVTYSSRRHRHDFSSTYRGGDLVGGENVPATGGPIRSLRASSESELARESTSQSRDGSISAGATTSTVRTRASFSIFGSGNPPTEASLSSASATFTAGNANANVATSRSSIGSYLWGGNSRSSSPAVATKATATTRKSITSSGGASQAAAAAAAAASSATATGKSTSANALERISEEELAAPAFQVEEFDPVFNLLDNLSALLCCAFLHVELIDSLFELSTTAKLGIANKSRTLLINFLRILAEVLPESTCAELLTNPTLIDLASSLGSSSRSSSQAHKASQLLVDLAEAFTIMPYKQTSGVHASNLSTTSVKARSGSILSKSGSGSSTAAVTPVQPSGVSSKSNFLPLNIRTVFDLTEEIKVSSLTSLSIQKRSADSNVSVYAQSNARSLSSLCSLRSSLTPSVDKADLARQMELSRVIGKEGKEPFKWDWVSIADMLEYSFQHSERLSEALKTKWVRRISGFYRCSIEEKGYFANLEWEPTNLQYLECACNLYSVLLRDDAGLSFLTSDRRGMLFNEMAQEIEQLVTSTAARGWLGSPSSGVKSVFRMYSCTTLMARELFTLLGRIVRTPGSRKLLEHTNLFEHLSRLGQFKSLDYVTRLVITSLCFTDGGLLSRHLLQLWTTSPSISQDFRQYLHNLLRVMIQSVSSNENYSWSIDAVVNQLSLEDGPNKVLFKAMEEAMHSKSSVRIMVSKRPRLMADPCAQHILLRFLSVPEGITYLVEKNWLENALSYWSNQGCKEYVVDVEDKISTTLTRPATDFLSDLHKKVNPIPIRTPEIVREILARQGTATQNVRSEDSGKGPVSSSDPNTSLTVDLQGFMRVPWSIEAKMVGGPNNNQGLAPQGDPITAAGEYLKVDTYLGNLGSLHPSSPHFYFVAILFRFLHAHGLFSWLGLVVGVQMCLICPAP